MPLSAKNARRILTLVLPALLGLILLAACGGAPAETARPATTTPTAAATDTPTAAATSASTERPAAPGYPRDVVDLLGRTVTIPDKPRAIVAISPTATEFVYAVGGTIIGRSESVDYPPEAAQAPSTGTAYQPSFEAILALEPDLVVADSSIHTQPNIMAALEGLNVPVIFAGAESLEEVAAGLALLGEALDNPAAAATVAAGIEAARASAREALAGLELTAVLLISDRDRNLYGAKASSYAGAILEALGITNPADVQPDSGPFPGFTRIAPEAMLQFDPAYIFTVTPAPPPAPKLSGLLGFFPGFSGLQAIAEGRVFELDMQLFVQAPGPRVVEAFAAIVAAVAGQ